MGKRTHHSAKEGNTVTEKNVLEDDGSMILSYRGEIPCWYRQDIRGSVTNIVRAEAAQ